MQPLLSADYYILNYQRENVFHFCRMQLTFHKRDLCFHGFGLYSCTKDFHNPERTTRIDEIVDTLTMAPFAATR